MNATATQSLTTEAQNQYLTFTLGEEDYGVEILRVQEIRGYTAITPIPNMPVFVKGVINLRGTVVPVVDLRSRFGMPTVEYSKSTVIIVVNVGKHVIGCVVDAVSDVLDVAANSIEKPPALGEGVDLSFLRGITRNNEDLIALLDIEHVTGIQEAAGAALAAPSNP
jgi:purine-binding chemotaxis protein CheW